MTTLVIDVKDLMFGISVFSVPDYQDKVTIDYDHGPTTISISGLTDWSDWQNQFIENCRLIIGNDANQISFEII